MHVAGHGAQLRYSSRHEVPIQCCSNEVDVACGCRDPTRASIKLEELRDVAGVFIDVLGYSVKFFLTFSDISAAVRNGCTIRGLRRIFQNQCEISRADLIGNFTTRWLQDSSDCRLSHYVSICFVLD